MEGPGIRKSNLTVTIRKRSDTAEYSAQNKNRKRISRPNDGQHLGVLLLSLQVNNQKRNRTILSSEPPCQPPEEATSPSNTCPCPHQVPSAIEPLVLNIEEVSRLVGMHPCTIYRQIARDDFPDRIQLSANRVGWLRADIEQWLRDRQDPDSPSGSTRSG